jgi:hypothetical protein
MKVAPQFNPVRMRKHAMKVKFTNPNNKKFGTTEHIENTTGRTLIALGECEEVCAPLRTSPDWLAWRKEQDALRTGPSIYDTVPSAPKGIEWGIKQTGKKVLVLKKVDGQLFFLDGPPKDAPASIVQQFLDAAAKDPEANAVAIEAAKRKQQEQDRTDKSLGNRTVMAALFGSKPL